MTLSTNLLDKTEQLFHSVRVNMLEAAVALYEVQKTEAWKERFETYQDFIHAIGISQGQASKYVSVIDHYLTNGGLSHAKLAEIEMEKLYLARGLEGTPEEQVTKALVLSRSEIRAQKVYEETGAEHTHNYRCTVCGIPSPS